MAALVAQARGGDRDGVGPGRQRRQAVDAPRVGRGAALGGERRAADRDLRARDDGAARIGHRAFDGGGRGLRGRRRRPAERARQRSRQHAAGISSLGITRSPHLRLITARRTRLAYVTSLVAQCQQNSNKRCTTAIACASVRPRTGTVTMDCTAHDTSDREAGPREPGRASATPLEVRFARTELSRQRRQLIRAILDNPKEAYFLSSRELARRYSVDAATIVRTIQALGYQRFADFAADLREHFVRQITPYTVAKAASQEKRSVGGHVEHGLDRDSENLSVLKSTLDTDRVVELATQIHRSRRILVVGVDLAASLAWFLAYGLMPVGLDAEAPVGSAGNLQHKIDLLTDKDLLIAISFGRCLQRHDARGAAGHGRGASRRSASPTAAPRRSRCTATPTCSPRSAARRSPARTWRRWP